MDWQKLKAYLQNPDVALENLKRIGAPTEGDMADRSERNLKTLLGKDPTHEEIVADMQNNQEALDNAAGVVGAVGKAKSTAELLRDAPASKYGRLVMASDPAQRLAKTRAMLQGPVEKDNLLARAVEDALAHIKKQGK